MFDGWHQTKSHICPNPVTSYVGSQENGKVLATAKKTVMPRFVHMYVIQGCQIFLGTIYQSGEKIFTKRLQKLQNGHKIYTMVVKYY
jgi:hypothetical protein